MLEHLLMSCYLMFYNSASKVSTCLTEYLFKITLNQTCIFTCRASLVVVEYWELTLLLNSEKILSLKCFRQKGFAKCILRSIL